MHVWDAETGTLQFRASSNTERIIGLAFSPDGTLLASAGQFVTQLWDVNRGREELVVGHPFACLAVAFSPDGRRLATTLFELPKSIQGKDSSEVAFWLIEDGRGIRSLHGPDHRGDPLPVCP